MNNDLALDAIMAMLDRYGGLWSNDRDHVRHQMEVILNAYADLSDDFPNGNEHETATATLTSLLTRDAQ